MNSRTSAASFFLLSLLVVAPQPAPAQDDDTDRRTISVIGRGETNADANLALVSFAVETTAESAAAAVEENARRSAQVAAALKQKIGAGDELKTLRYSLQPRYDHPKHEPGEPKILGYTASNEVGVETGDVDGVGKLIDAAIAAGANRINNLTFTLRNRDEIVRQAIEKAGHDARAQAEAAARSLGVTLKRVFSASTLSPTIFQPRMAEGFGRAAMAQVSTPVEPGTVAVSAELQVRYEIE
jgi:uncharacterized protein YggE